MLTAQRIVIAPPPNLEASAAVFPAARKPGTFFSWGDLIYNPTGVMLPPQIIAHELVHGQRQEGCIEDWWNQYLTDKDFRFNEELLAHVAEYKLIHDTQPLRNARRHALRFISARLASPLYGRVIGEEQAKKLIMDGVR